MFVSKLKLDQYDDNFSELTKIASDPELNIKDLPGKIIPQNQLKQLSADDFGLILVGDDTVKALFPITDAKNTAISLHYLKKSAPILNKINPDLLPIAKYFVGKAAKEFGIIDSFNPVNTFTTNTVDLRNTKVEVIPKKPSIKQEAHKVAEQVNDILHNTNMMPSKRLIAATIIANAAKENPELAEALQEIIPTEFDEIKKITNSEISPVKVKQTIVVLKKMLPDEEPTNLLDKLRTTVDASGPQIPINVLDTIHSLMMGYNTHITTALPDPISLLDPPRKIMIVVRGQQFPPELLHGLLAQKAPILRYALAPKIAEEIINDPFAIENMPEDIQDIVLNLLEG